MSISNCLGSSFGISFEGPVKYALPSVTLNHKKNLCFRKPIRRKLLIPAISPVFLTTRVQAVDQLPPKLHDIITLFEGVSEPRSKYDQLMHYGKKLKPLAKQFKNKENKVEGCVSQVWVRAFLDDNKGYFEADSDSVLTKGLAALLVEGLSGSSPAQILRVTPDFVHRLGLKQSLTPSRNNGFLNMLKLMQKKTLQLLLEAERAAKTKDVNVNSKDLDDNGINVGGEAKQEPPVGIEEKEIKSVGSAVTSRLDRIRQKLETELEPMVLEMEDVSHQHAGHAAMQDQAKETHFNFKIVSAKFEGLSLVKRHRLVYELLDAELQSGLHALSITVKTPLEMERL